MATVTLDDLLAVINAQNSAITARLDTLEARIAAPSAAPQTARTARTERQTADTATREKYQNAGGPRQIEGTVVRLSGGKTAGYAALINEAGTNVWIKVRTTGKDRKPFPASIVGRVLVADTYNEFGYVKLEDIKLRRALGVPTQEQHAQECQEATQLGVAGTSNPGQPGAIGHAPAQKTQRGGAGCAFCNGPTHAKDSVKEVSESCLMRQYTTETGDNHHNGAYTTWKNQQARFVFAHNRSGKRLYGGDEAPADQTVATPAPQKAATSSPERTAARKARLAALRHAS